MYQNKRRDEREARGENDQAPTADETAFADLTDWENPNFRCEFFY